MRTVAVIPAYNERASVGDVVAQVGAQGLDVVVVDDGSADETGSAAKAAGAVVLRHPTNIGVGGAHRTGFRFAVGAGYRRVVQIDADRQHDPSSIADLVAAADHSGAELVIGSRFGAAGYPVPKVRRLLMGALARLVSRRVGTRLGDVTSGFRVVTEPLLSEFAERYPTEYLADTVESILAASATGAGVIQCPVKMAARTEGEATTRTHAVGHLLRLLVALAVTPRRGVA